MGETLKPCCRPDCNVYHYVHSDGHALTLSEKEKDLLTLLVRERWDANGQATASAHTKESEKLWNDVAVETHNLLNKLEATHAPVHSGEEPRIILSEESGHKDARFEVWNNLLKEEITTTMSLPARLDLAQTLLPEKTLTGGECKGKSAARALAVLVLDPLVNEFLTEHSPMTLNQARNALAPFGYPDLEALQKKLGL